MSEHKRQRRSVFDGIAGFGSDSVDLCEQSEALKYCLSNLLQTCTAKEQACARAAKYVQDSYDGIIDAAETQAKELISAAKETAASIVADAKVQIEVWEAEKIRLAVTQQFLPKVKLDVGGSKHTTSLTTLRRFPDTMIGAMFSGRHALPLDGEGYHFIDRDGAHFRHILNFLRSPETFAVDLAEPQLKELKSECEFYGLSDLMFPFVPLAPFETLTHRNNLVAVSQDADAVFSVENVPLRICAYCPSVQCHDNGVEKNLKDFRDVVEKKGGTFGPNQPHILGLCQACKKYKYKKVNLAEVVFKKVATNSNC